MKLTIEIVNKVEVQNQILARELDRETEFLKNDLEKKVKNVSDKFLDEEEVFIRIDYFKSKATLSADNIANNREEIVRDILNNIQ